MTKYIDEQLAILAAAMDNPPDSSVELDNLQKRMDSSEQPELMTDEEILKLPMNGWGSEDAGNLKP